MSLPQILNRVISSFTLFIVFHPVFGQMPFEGELIPKPSMHKTAKVNYLRMLDNGVVAMCNSGKYFGYDGHKFFHLDENGLESSNDLSNLSAICRTRSNKLLLSTLNQVYELDSDFFFKKFGEFNSESDQHFQMNREEFINFTVYHYINYWQLSKRFAELNGSTGYFINGDSLYYYKNKKEKYLQRVTMLPQAEISNGRRMFLFTSNAILLYNDGIFIKNIKTLNVHGRSYNPSDIYRVFYCEGRYYSLGKFGLARLNVKSNSLTGNIIIDSSRIRNYHVLDLVVSKDERLIYFSSDSGLYRYTHQWAQLFKPQLSEFVSSNSLLFRDNFIYANRGGKYTLDGRFFFAPESYLEFYGSGYAYDNEGNIYYSRGDSSVVRSKSGKLINWGRKVYQIYSYIPHGNEVIILFNKEIYQQNKYELKPSKYKIENTETNYYTYGGIFYKNLFLVASSHGLLVFDEVSGKRLSNFELVKDPVYRVQKAPELDGVFLFTYGSGIFYFDGLKVIKLPNDLENHLNIAHGIRVDRFNRAWLPTNSAMVVCNYQEILDFITKQESKPRYYILNTIAGIKDPEFNGRSDSSSITIESDSSVYYCSVHGVFKIFPERFSSRLLTAAPSIGRSIIDGKIFSGFYIPNGQHQQFSLELLIPIEHNSLLPRIEFKLNDNEWMEAVDGKIQFARKSGGLQSLSIRFKFDMRDKDYSYKNYQFYIQPYWYETNWAKILGLIFLGLIFYLILRIRELRLRRRQAILELLVEEKTKALSSSLMELNTSKIQLQESDAFKERLIRVLAHDIRSPLMSAYYVSEYMHRELGKDHQHSELLEMSKEVKLVIKSLHDYSNDFIAWYNLMKGTTQVEFKSTPLKATLSGVLQFYESALKTNGNEINLIGLENEFTVLSDQNILKIIFRNLIDNANKYSSNSVIEIKATELNKNVILSFTNNATELSEKRKIEMLESLSQESSLLVPIEGQKLGLTMLNFFCNKLNLNLSLQFLEGNKVCFSIEIQVYTGL
jgi:signal transduction histidine kinase